MEEVAEGGHPVAGAAEVGAVAERLKRRNGISA
jgi:hypothetical protein